MFGVLIQKILKNGGARTPSVLPPLWDEEGEVYCLFSWDIQLFLRTQTLSWRVVASLHQKEEKVSKKLPRNPKDIFVKSNNGKMHHGAAGNGAQQCGLRFAHNRSSRDKIASLPYFDGKPFLFVLFVWNDPWIMKSDVCLPQFSEILLQVQKC